VKVLHALVCAFYIEQDNTEVERDKLAGYYIDGILIVADSETDAHNKLRAKETFGVLKMV
jgi:hypothetical protein